LPGAKFFVEVIDLIRYLNLIIFLSRTVRDYSESSLNRTGRHPVENLFGLVRVACHSGHSWDLCLAAIAKGRLVEEILSLNDTKPPHRRDFPSQALKQVIQLIISSIW
jgi:hypothetical protein